MKIEKTYIDTSSMLRDFVFDAERRLPVELVCKANEIKSYLGKILVMADVEIELLIYEPYDDNTKPDDEMSIEIRDKKLFLSPLIVYSERKGRCKLKSAEDIIRYISSDSDGYFKDDSDKLLTIEYTIGGQNGKEEVVF